MLTVNTEDMEPVKRPCAVCLGYFDGVHLGHMALVNAAGEIARQHGLLVCVHTLDRSPFEALHPEVRLLQLTGPKEKARLFEAAGVDVLAISSFTQELRCMPGRDFFHKILLGKLNARAVITGDDHRFGYRGDTGIAELAELCRETGTLLRVIPRVRLDDGTVISSSSIRDALKRGDLESAQKMLGRPADRDMLERLTGSTGRQD